MLPCFLYVISYYIFNLCFILVEINGLGVVSSAGASFDVNDKAYQYVLVLKFY